MTTRLPASQRTREELSAVIEGRLRTASATDELVRLATRLIVEEALEGEAGESWQVRRSPQDSHPTAPPHYGAVDCARDNVGAGTLARRCRRSSNR
jgi:hypothetical protein